MEKTFFVADIHAGHKNCLAFDNRPFKSIEENDFCNYGEKAGK